MMAGSRSALIDITKWVVSHRLRLDQYRTTVADELLAYWTWARPVLNPIDMSLVIRDGDDGYAAVLKGSYSLFAPGAPPSGPLDGAL
jgi:hypothetical protein